MNSRDYKLINNDLGCNINRHSYDNNIIIIIVLYCTIALLQYYYCSYSLNYYYYNITYLALPKCLVLFNGLKQAHQGYTEGCYAAA